MTLFHVITAEAKFLSIICDALIIFSISKTFFFRDKTVYSYYEKFPTFGIITGVEPYCFPRP